VRLHQPHGVLRDVLYRAIHSRGGESVAMNSVRPLIV
jgi:hypothetical protein